VSDDSEERVRAILMEASALLGEGDVRLEVVSAPVIEWVYVGLEDKRVVVSDKGATFGWIAGVHGVKDEFVDWSPERARVPADTFGVSLIEPGWQPRGLVGRQVTRPRRAQAAEPERPVVDRAQR
jgi:hypothetical protein